jgi:hypothetical protein
MRFTKLKKMINVSISRRREVWRSQVLVTSKGGIASNGNNGEHD